MSGALYSSVYLFVVFVMTLFMYNYYKQTNYNVIANRREVSPLPSLALAAIMAVWIGLRPQHYAFVDMNNYIAYYDLNLGDTFFYDPDAENLIFDNFFSWMSSMAYHWQWFFLVIAIIYFIGMWYSCRRLFPKDTMLALLVCLGAFSTFSYGTNGVKAGAAASLFLIAMSYYGNWKMSAIFLALSLGFHHSMVLPIAAFVLAWFYLKPQLYFKAWMFSLVVAALHITAFQHLFGSFADESGAAYLLSEDDDWGGKAGFRIDFIIYSAMPVAVGYWVLVKKHIRSRMYEFLLSVYLISNSVWMLCMYAEFTNRIAYLSWFMYPVVLIYPFFIKEMGEQRYKMLAKAVLLHVMFTAFMQVVYY